MKCDLLREAAATFCADHFGEHLATDRHHLVERCAEHLVAMYPVTHEAAQMRALQVLGELESHHRGAYVDVNRCTSHAVIVVDPRTGMRTGFTAADLLAFARHRSVRLSAPSCRPSEAKTTHA